MSLTPPNRILATGLFALGLFLTAFLPAQSPTTAPAALSGVSHVIVPQARGFAMRAGDVGLSITRVNAAVSILEQAATTTLTITVGNPGPRRAEAVLLLPTAPGAAVSAFQLGGGKSAASARLLPRNEARRTYDAIVAKIKDPALLEFAGYDLIRSSVFPVPPRGTQTLRITWDHLVPKSGARTDFTLTRSEALGAKTPWEISVRLRSKRPISTVYSPSHPVNLRRVGPHELQVTAPPAALDQPGPFRLSWLQQTGAVSASLLAYPDPEVGGGYFLLLAGLPAHLPEAKRVLRREVTVVIDRSGSMAGAKMDQVRAAALQVIEGLADGESFNVLDYSNTVESFAPAPVAKTRESTLEARRYLAALRPGGGTNIHDALLQALRQPAREGCLPLVFFLTDGLPTIGQTGEVAIRDAVAAGNPHRRRIFTFGVGEDVNAPLLDRVAESTKGSSTYVLPGEDVEVKVGEVFSRLYGPVLSDVRLETLDAEGAVTTRRIRELMPTLIPDLFEGDQLVLLGQYRGAEPLDFRLSGNYLGKPRRFSFRFSLEKASTRNAFVPRLWASRRIAFLSDQIRQSGAALAAVPGGNRRPLSTDPRTRELVDEILRLSTRFGVLSEYTAFLATEGTDLADWGGLLRSCDANYASRAVHSRSGRGAVSQSGNIALQKQQKVLNYRNSFVDENRNRVEVSNVQQICDRAFFRRGATWVDGRTLQGGAAKPSRVIEFGSPAFRKLLQDLLRENRQGVLSLRGELLLRHRGETVLIKNTGR